MTCRTLILCAVALSWSLGCAGGRKDAYPVDTTTIAPGQQLESPARWYDDAVIYQVWVRAFADGAYGDGIGDLAGVAGKLDYLQGLGVDTVWLSPIFECAYKGPNLHGYDTTDYYAVNDRFGTKADLKALLDAAHGRGMRVIFDFVPNHTSTVHPWFTGPTSRTWYVWQDSLPAGWGYPWGGGDSSSVWTSQGGAYYYTAFGGGMADLNYYNPEVRAELQKVVAYWLDRGFDGMRVDAVRYLCESGPGQQADTADTHARLQEFRSVLDSYLAAGNAHPRPSGDPSKYSGKMMVAEAWTDAPRIGAYFGTGSNEFQMCLDFNAPWAVFNAINGGDATQVTSLWEYERDHYPAGFRMASFDSNHDNVISRPGSQYGGNRARIILAEALNLLAPGTPILYYGNEVGMTGVAGNDLDLRQPMDWAAAAAQASQPDSIFSWCKYFIQARKAYPALRGGFATLATDAGVKILACLRSAGSERVAVVANLTASPQTFNLTDLATKGVAAGTTVSPILGTVNNSSWVDGAYRVATLPPYGVRVLHLGGSPFKGTLHGDLQ